MKSLVAVFLLLVSGIAYSETYSLGRDQILWGMDVGAYSTPNDLSSTIDAAGEKFGFTAHFPPATYNQFEVFTGNITTGDTITWRLESVAENSSVVGISTGNPSGNLLCANSSGTITLGSADDLKWIRTSTMVASCTITVSTPAALVFYQTGSFNGNVRGNSGGFTTSQYSLSHTSNSTSGWVKSGAAGRFAALDNNLNYIPIVGVFPSTAFPATAFNSGSSPSYRGSRIYLPTGLSIHATGAVLGAASLLYSDVILYDTAGVGLATATLNVASSLTVGKLVTLFDTPVSLSGGSTYYLMLKPRGTQNCTLNGLGMNTAAIANAYAPSYSRSATATTPGTWTVEENIYTFLNLLYDSFTISTTASGAGAFPYVQ